MTASNTGLPAGREPERSAPEDGSEFKYLCNDGNIRRGTLGHDLGGSIRRDWRMIGWRYPVKSVS